MKRSDKEFNDLMDQFEKDLDTMSVYVGATPVREKGRSAYYTNDTINKLFIGYLNGYQYAKCLARMNSLELNE